MIDECHNEHKGIQTIKVSKATDGKFVSTVNANLDCDDINRIK